MSHKAVPFAIAIQRLFRRDSVSEHEFEFGVARAAGLVRVVIESDHYDNPRIVERRGKGGIDLDDRLIDRLSLIFYNLMVDQLRLGSGEKGWQTFNDITLHVRKKLIRGRSMPFFTLCRFT